ncbi:endonuclease domain-containing protein [Thermostaphylospora chromogena]|nr:DUF559 domain-containing protein [Thermostaphylospora chromogena]
MDLVRSVLAELEKAALELFPAWLPGAEAIQEPCGAGRRAVRRLALRLAAETGHFGPFLADLAERSLNGMPSATGTEARRVAFAPEVRAAELARVLAACYGRRGTALLVNVPDGLSAVQEEALVAGCDWLADRGHMAVWLTGVPPAVDRLAVATVAFPGAQRDREEARRPEEPGGPTRPGRAGAPGRPDGARGDVPALTYPPVAGRPHPVSEAERVLEAALAPLGWATGRAWNQTLRLDRFGTICRVDLLWRQERCVVEVDGPEHRGERRFEEDRHRDVCLQLAGYGVLRFTNAQVLKDTETVVRQIGRFVRGRRLGTLEG